jgi:thymidylate synthase
MDMNMLAMTELQKHVAEKVGLHVGRYVDYSDSLHIYDRDWEMVERFLTVLDKRRSASP